jgi:DNA-binding transcriptional LysR family regulator
MGMRRFKTLIAIAELGTFAKAAESVCLTPAAVSQQMKALEEELGILLFDRTKRPPELNPAGYFLVPKAKELVGIYDALKPSLFGEVDTVEQLTVGSVPTTMTGIIPKALKALQDDHDNLHIRVYPGLSDDLYAQVDRGFLDAAILTEPPAIHKHLLWRPFTAEPLVVLVSIDTKSDDPREILQTQPFIRFARKAWVGRMIDRWLLQNNIQVNETMETDTLEAIAAMVMNNIGVAIAPMSCCPTPWDRMLRSIPLGDSSMTRVLGVICRRDTSKHKLVDILSNKLLHIVEESNRTRPIGQSVK